MSLPNSVLQRFSRQILIPEIGIEGQRKILQGSVLVIGTGGLGAPSSMYLAGAGIGRLGLVDHDSVELSNLHRQVIHSESRVGMSKVESAKQFLSQLSSATQIETFNTTLTESNALSIIKPFDVVLDCTDNITTRYLINDSCVLLGKPLVSASALKFEGHITVYNYSRKHPCFRCLFPVPPPASAISNCNEAGIFGPVTGILGSMQALEALKILIGGQLDVLAGKMVIFDATTSTFRNVTLRGRSIDCQICGDSPTIVALLPNYQLFCGAGHERHDRCDLSGSSPRSHEKMSIRNNVNEQSALRISCIDYNEQILNEIEHVLIDVRDENQYKICHLSNSINIPLSQLANRLEEIPRDKPIFVMCRMGVSSVKAADLLRNSGFDRVKDIEGGIHSWALKCDTSMPVY